jgi:hypothetical protein
MNNHTLLSDDNIFRRPVIINQAFENLKTSRNLRSIGTVSSDGMSHTNKSESQIINNSTLSRAIMFRNRKINQF